MRNRQKRAAQDARRKALLDAVKEPPTLHYGVKANGINQDFACAACDAGKPHGKGSK